MKVTPITESIQAERSVLPVRSFSFLCMPCSMGCNYAQRLSKNLWQWIVRIIEGYLRAGVGRQPSLWFLLIMQTAVVSCVWAESNLPIPTLETIIFRMTQSQAENRIRFRPYVVTRNYIFFGKEREKSKAQVIADVSFVPPDSKNYTIQQTKGSGLGERVVRRMLESEIEIAKNQNTTDISPNNYDFRFDGEEVMNGMPCYRLELLPKRKDKNLLKALIWVDTKTFAIRRMEGEPAKSLSWWLRNVRISFLFEEIGGMWLPTATESTVNVRILGRYTMVSSSIQYRMGEQVAAVSSDDGSTLHFLIVEKQAAFAPKKPMSNETVE